MRLEDLQPYNSKKDRKRIGRGGKRGTYSGKGLKGQNSRAGTKFQPAIRYLIKRYPKLRGYRYHKTLNEVAVVDLATLNKKFTDKNVINPQALVKAGLVAKYGGKVPKVKILGSGDLTKALFISRCSCSKSAEQKIIKAGGTIKAMPVFHVNTNLLKKAKPRRGLKKTVVIKEAVPDKAPKKTAMKKAAGKVKK